MTLFVASTVVPTARAPRQERSALGGAAAAAGRAAAPRNATASATDRFIVVLPDIIIGVHSCGASSRAAESNSRWTKADRA